MGPAQYMNYEMCTVQCTEGGQRNNVSNFGLRILHHNVQSLLNKQKKR